MLYGKASSYYGFFCQSKVMSVCRFCRQSILLLTAFSLSFLRHFKPSVSLYDKKCVKIVTFFGLLCLRLIFLFLLYGICVTKQRVFTFKLLVACLRPVTRPLFTQKWATFYA